VNFALSGEWSPCECHGEVPQTIRELSVNFTLSGEWLRYPVNSRNAKYHVPYICSVFCGFYAGHWYHLSVCSMAAQVRPNGTVQGRVSQFKVVLLGESAVGKSSLVLRFVKGQFHEYQESTIGGTCV